MAGRFLLASLTLLGTAVQAQNGPVTRPIRICGYRFGDTLVKAWEEGYRKLHPEVKFETQLRGNASAIGLVYTGAADIALMGREIWPIEVEGYDQAMGAKPTPIAVAKTTGLSIFVHKDNYLTNLTLVQMDAIFGADHRRGPTSIKTWSQLGGANQPINLYGYGIERHYSQFFEQAVFQGSRKWNCNLHEMQTGKEILDALAKDPYGLAIATAVDHNALAKPVALLARHLWVVITQPVNPNVKAFIDYILSREGQQLIGADGRYLPLNSVQ